MTHSQGRFYRPELDVLRFCAATGVFIFHASPKGLGFWIEKHVPMWLAIPVHAISETGSFGVDLFFVLSAFLITELMLREKDLTGYLDVRDFYLRRILRIWPLYFFFIALCYGLNYLDTTQHLSGRFVLALTLLLGNWAMIRWRMQETIAVVLWSVSLEEQFYLSWPQVVSRCGIVWIKRIAMGLLLVGFSTRFVLLFRGASEQRFWFNTLVRLDPIALGILFAIYAHGREFHLTMRKRLALSMAAALAWSIVGHFGWLHQTPIGFWGAIVGYPAVSFGSLAMLVSVYRVENVTWLAEPKLVYFGKISYGIYVYHELGLLISKHLWSRYTKLAWGFAFYVVSAWILTLLMAAASYSWLESPFLRLKERFAPVKSRPI